MKGISQRREVKHPMKGWLVLSVRPVMGQKRGGGIALEHCAVTDDGRSCALEYNAVAWGQTELPPEAGMAVYVRGDSGKLATARIYDDVDPPLRGSL